MDLLDTYRNWLTRQPAHTRPLLLVAIATIPVALLAALAFLAPTLAPLGGTLAGLGLFAAVYGYGATTASPELRDRFDLTTRYPLGRRRTQVAAATVIWVLLILLAGRYAPAPLLGTLTVFVALCLIQIARPTPDEAAALEVEAQARAEAAALEADATEFDYADNDDEDPNYDADADR